MQANSFSYSLKVWLTSVVLAPVILFITNPGSYEQPASFVSLASYLSNAFVFYIMCVIFGWLFSFLTWLTFLFMIKGFIASFPSWRLLKHLIAITGVLLTIGTFAFLRHEAFNTHDKYFYLMLTYAACIAVGSLFYKFGGPVEPDAGSG